MFNETWIHACMILTILDVYYRYYKVFHVASQTLVTPFFLQKPNFGTAKLPFFRKKSARNAHGGNCMRFKFDGAII